MVAVEALRPLRQALAQRVTPVTLFPSTSTSSLPVDNKLSASLLSIRPSSGFQPQLQGFLQHRPAVAGAPLLSRSRQFSSTSFTKAREADDEDWCPTRQLKKWWTARSAVGREQQQQREVWREQGRETGWGRAMFSSSSSFGWDAGKSPFYHQRGWVRRSLYFHFARVDEMGRRNREGFEFDSEGRAMPEEPFRPGSSSARLHRDVRAVWNGERLTLRWALPAKRVVFFSSRTRTQFFPPPL
jgi:hypothetical protein